MPTPSGSLVTHFMPPIPPNLTYKALLESIERPPVDSEAAKEKARLITKYVVCKTTRITPKLAALSPLINCRNRERSKGQVEKLAHELKSGRYKFTHQGVAFDDTGALVDGQHRLLAILMSGVTVNMFVTTGLDKDAFEAVDVTNRGRTAGDLLYLKYGDRFPPGKTQRVAGIANAMRGYGTTVSAHGRNKNKRLSAPELAEYCAQHADALNWVMENYRYNESGVSRAAVPAAIARAWYSRVSRTKLALFAEILNTGIPRGTNAEQVIKLRTYLVSNNLAGHMASQQAYRKVEYVLKAYLEDREVPMVREARTEQFPIPGDPVPETLVAEAQT